MKQIKRIIYLVLVLCMFFASCTDQAKTKTDITTDAIEPMAVVTQKADETSEYAEKYGVEVTTEVITTETTTAATTEPTTEATTAPKEPYVESPEKMCIKERMEADMLLEDTYEVSRSSDLPDLLISIIDTTDAAAIKQTYGITYEYIVEYLNHIIAHGSTHSTVIGAWMHRLAAMKDTGKIDVVLGLLKEYDKDFYLDILKAICTYSEGDTSYFNSLLQNETTPEAPVPTEPKYITETVTFDFVRYFEGSIEVGGGTFDGDISITYTYAEGVKPAGFSLFDVSGDEDFPENGYYEEMQTHNGWRPAWATVTKRSILRRDAGDILIEYVDGENNGPVIVYWRASDDYIIEFSFSEGTFVTDADIEMFSNTFVFKDLTVEDWTYTYITPNYDAWEGTEGEYVIWEFTKNADGEFELTYSEGDILCIPYVTIGSDKVIYATTKTIIPPALEIGKLHILKAHDEIVRLFLEDTLKGSVVTNVADGIYAENFAKYCEAEPEKADILRERSGKLRDVFKVYINGEAVDGIGVALPSYCFIKDYQYEWQFIFSKAYAKEEVNTVRIELKIPEQQESTTSDVSQSEPANVLSGSCGEGVSYTFDTDSGEVHIFGIGEMSFYGDEFVPTGFAPWHYDARVKSVVIEDGVTSICDMAFYGCSGLSNVTIPQSVTSIGKDAFNGCHSLREISVPDSVTYIGDGTFTYCDSLKEFVIPQGVTSISASMFFACEKLEKITIPDTVTYIGYDAFKRCNSLSEISIPSSVTEIGELAFAYCSSLKEITLPQGVTNLNRGTFYNCTALEKITLPEGLTSIGVTVFHGSAALLEITIPGSVTSIDETAFIYGNLSLVRAPLGSYTEQFAKDNNIEFEEVNDYVS